MRYSKHKEKVSRKKIDPNPEVLVRKSPFFYNLLVIIWNAINFLNPYNFWHASGIADQIDYWISLVKTRFSDNAKQKSELLEWVATKTGGLRAPRNFTSDWSCGITLCALLEAIVPGSCPRYDLLNPENAIQNIQQGLAIANEVLDIETNLDAEKLFEGNAESGLISLLTRLKLAAAKRRLRSAINRPIVKVTPGDGKTELNFSDNQCFAKGMGLILAVRGRRARFNIFFRTISKLNLIVEIIGPDNCKGSHRVIDDIQSLLGMTDKESPNRKSRRASRRDVEIPVTCEVLRQKVAVTYVPVVTGCHTLSIIWEGQHITGSPYTVKVDDSTDDGESRINGPSLHPASCFPLFRGISCRTPLKSTVIRRRILKQVVLINGEEVPYVGNLNLFKDIDVTEPDATPRSRCNSVSGIHIRPRLADIVQQKFQEHVSSSSSASGRSSPVSLPSSDDEPVHLEIPSITETQPEIDSTHEDFTQVAADENRSSPVHNDLICNYAMTEFDMPREIFMSICKPVSSFDDLCDEKDALLNNSKLESAFQMVAEEAVGDLASVQTIESLLERGGTPFQNYLPRDGTKFDFAPKNIQRQIFLSKSAALSESKKSSGKKCDIQSPHLQKRISLFETGQLSSANKSHRAKSPTEQLIGKVVDVRRFWEALDRTQQESGDAKSLRKSRSLKVRPSEPITLPANGDLDATTPDSQADSGIGPATTVSKQLLEAIKLSSTSPPRDDLDNHNVLQPLREVPFPSVTRIRKRSHSFPLMSAAHQVDNCDSAKRYSLCRDSSMDTDCSGNRTLTSAQGFIDDEIGDFSSFVGNYVSLSSSREEMLEDIKREPTEAVKEVNPERCKASGAGLYYGQVNTKNTFEVTTADAGLGFLSASIKGLLPEDVHFVSVRYIREDTYEVSFEVKRPGYYVTSVRWSDYHITDSPFICKVSY